MAVSYDGTTIPTEYNISGDYTFSNTPGESGDFKRVTVDDGWLTIYRPSGSPALKIWAFTDDGDEPMLYWSDGNEIKVYNESEQYFPCIASGYVDAGGNLELLNSLPSNSTVTLYYKKINSNSAQSGFFNGSDSIDGYCEPFIVGNVEEAGYDYSAANNYIATDGNSLRTRFQMDPTNHETFPFYDSEGQIIPFAMRGYCPLMQCFHTITTNGTKYMSRTDSELKIGSTTYPASYFRNNCVPKRIGFLLVGAGGGGGGFGAEKGNKSGYNIDSGGSGGGGGIAAGYFEIPDGSSTIAINIGSGGANGSNGSTSSRPSSGGNGSLGGTSYIEKSNSRICTASGGGGGGGGTGTAYGSAGGAGYASFDSTVIISGQAKSGSPGNHCGNGGATVVSFSRDAFWDPGFNDAGAILTNNYLDPIAIYQAAAARESNPGDSWRAAYACGGCSYGKGGLASTSGIGAAAVAGGGGGGAACGRGSSAGATGRAMFFY